MPASRHALACILLIALGTKTNAECADSTRIRRPWHSLSDEDQMLYVNGFQQLHEKAILIEFVEAHQKATGHDDYNIHKSAQNFFWHGYWLYEMENSIRALGPEYECFTMPYWDVSVDGAYWNGVDDPQIEDIPIYQTKLGGEGNVDNDYCVDGIWSIDNYFTDELCADDEEDGKCCLKRQHAELDDLNRTTVLYIPKHVAKYVYNNKEVEFSHFQSSVSGMHGDIHSFFGSVAGTHFCGDGNGAPDWDPLFPVFHTWIEYLRLMHQDCNDYDLIANEDLDDYMPYVFDDNYKGYNVSLDYVMDFSVLCDETNGKKPAICSNTDITPRLMFDVSPNTRFNLVYELGPFWHDNSLLRSLCADNLNDTWWLNDMETDTDTDTDTDTEDDTEESMLSRSMSGHGLRSEGTNVYTPTAMVVMLCGLVVMALMRWCMMRKEKDMKMMVDRGQGMAYGTV